MQPSNFENWWNQSFETKPTDRELAVVAWNAALAQAKTVADTKQNDRRDAYYVGENQAAISIGMGIDALKAK